MKDLLFIAVLVSAVYIFYRIMLKEPILPWKEKKPQTPKVKTKTGKTKKTANAETEEEEARPFQELFPNVVGIENHMIRHSNNTFSLMAEVYPVNYFLMNPSEQDAVDAIFETWLAQVEDVRWYLQNRFVDLTEPIKEIQKTMDSEDDLHPNAIEYGLNLIEELKNWQSSTPRYETKRFMVFDYRVDEKEIRAETDEELEEKIIDKAFNELHRRLTAAKMQLKKADIEVHMLTTDGISETLYYQFNRRRALKSQYRDFEEQEKLAMFVTADQTAAQILRVKGEIESAEEEKPQETAS